MNETFVGGTREYEAVLKGRLEASESRNIDINLYALRFVNKQFSDYGQGRHDSHSPKNGKKGGVKSTKMCLIF